MKRTLLFLLSVLFLASCAELSEALPDDPVPGNAPSVYAVSASDLYRVELSSGGEDTLVGTLTKPDGVTLNVTDTALAGNELYANTAAQLFEVDTSTAEVELIGNFGTSVNALAANSSRRLYGANNRGRLVTVDTATGEATTVGTFGDGLNAGGDLAFLPNGELYATSTQNELLKVDISTGQATEVGDIGFSNVFGLSYAGGSLYGFTGAGQLIRIDSETGEGTLVRELSFDALGGQNR